MKKNKNNVNLFVKQTNIMFEFMKRTLEWKTPGKVIAEGLATGLLAPEQV